MSYSAPPPPPDDEPVGAAGSPPPPPPESAPPPPPATPAGPPPGYSPPPAAGPPPGYSPPPATGGGMTGDQITSTFKNANQLDLGIIGAGVLAFLFSLFPYYTYSVSAFGFSESVSWSAWHGFFGWFGAFVALGVAVLLVLRMFGVVPETIPVRLISLAGFGVSTLCLLLALFIIPGSADCGGNKACEDAIDFGHGIGYWLSAIVIIAGLVLSFMRKDAED